MSTISRMFRDRVAATPRERAYSSFVGGRWRDFTWTDYDEAARSFGLGLIELGLQRGDVVAILGATRAEWATNDIGAIGAGGVTVGLYPTLLPEGLGSMRYVLEHSEAKYVAVENTATLKEKLGPILAKLPNVRRVVVWDHDAEAASIDPRVVSLADVLARGAALHAREPERWKSACDAARPEDLALLIYTSGTTGQPKGAMLSHGNVFALQESLAKILPADDPKGGHTVSFLPMAHAAERCVAHYGRIKQGYATHFARSFETLLDDIATARPTRFGSVPRIFEKVYARVQGELEKQTGVKGVLARAVYRAGLDAAEARRKGRTAPLPTRLLARLFEKKLARPLQERFGGQCGWFVSGAAPIAVEILELFDACGFETYEAYGMTETTAILTFNRPGTLRYGTVGKPIPGVELSIAGDGEILARGPNMFLGYFKEPAATAEIFDGGWLHTGDIGVFDADGFLRITDRKKNILVTAGGKNITPSNIENEVKNHPLVSFCHLHADKRPFPTALICLDVEQLVAFARERGLDGRSVADLREHPAVRAEIQRAVDRANAAFAQFERIKKFAIAPAEFSVEGGELTPTLKVRRREVDTKYAAVLDRLYEG